MNSHKGEEGIGAYELCREAERDSIIQPGEITDHGPLMHVYKYLVGLEVKNVNTDSSESCLMTGQEATSRNRNSEGIHL